MDYKRYGPYTIEDNGRVTLPRELRHEFGLRDGDEVIFERTAAGWLILTSELVIERLLDEVGAILTERGITLDELIASGRDIRGEIVRERYGTEGTDGAPGVS
jgi:AbrB family looped-hinge helix DNA binding protein